MNKAYQRIAWENYPSEETPINETNLNKMDSAIDTLDNRVISLDSTKAKESEVLTMVQEVEYNEATGVFTVTKKNGSKITIDTKLEKLAVNFYYDKATQKLVITLDDGTKQYVDLSALITQFEFLDSDTVAFTIDSDGKVKAIVKDGSITESKLQPNYLATIKVEVAKAQASSAAAEQSEKNAKASENAAKGSEANSLASANQAKLSETNAKESETNSKASETASAESEKNAKTYETSAKTSANSASSSQILAKTSETASKESETNSKKSETNAKASEVSALDSAQKSQSYAVGGTGSRDNEDKDNAKYYNEQAQIIGKSVPNYLRQIDKAANDAIAKVNDALESNTPQFRIDLTTGHLLYTGARFNFSVNQNNGHLNWEVV